MFCAVGRPEGQEVVVGIEQGAATTHRDESGIALSREDHEGQCRGCPNEDSIVSHDVA
jgi:hypothetical protein